MIVARKQEIQLLREAFDHDRSQLVAVYGRRRVGKTFLVRETFDYTFTFQHAGLAKGDASQQLEAFCLSVKEAGLTDFEQPNGWLEAFELLKAVIRSSTEKRKVIFLDELSWMDTPNSDFMVALEWFWNGWASARKDILLITCASATTWMLNKVIHNKDGLYNRVTTQIKLLPFTLRECEELCYSQGIIMSRHQLLECYMVFGGVPYYWSHLRRGLSLAQNIDLLFFSDGAPLAGEFDHLFASLFLHPDGYLSIVRALGGHKAGLTRNKIAELTKATSSGGLTTKLRNLESCGFIRTYRPFGKKRKGSLYQLVDCFTLFALKFCQGDVTDEHFWSNTVNTPARNAWRGLAFERVCLAHVPQIKAALGISGVATEVMSWSCKRDDDAGISGCQIDLLIVRQDHVINLCEMKYASREFAITKSVDEDIREKVCDFQTLTHAKQAIHVTFVTPYGLKHNAYRNTAQASITAEDLFA